MSKAERGQVQSENDKRRSHGAYAIEAGNALPIERLSITELKRSLDDPTTRRDVALEVAARTALICYKLFSDVVEINKDDFWKSPAVKRGGSWVAEFRRQVELLQKMDVDRATLARNVTDMLRGDDGSD